MKSAWIFYKKEMLEAARNYKLIWVPIVFLMLGIMQPLSTYYLPDILSMSANIPKEAAALFETPPPAKVVAQTMSQYSTVGLLVLVLAGMNTVAGERLSGTGELLLARSVSPAAMIFAKWAAMMTLLVISLALGLAGSAYYTEQLIGSVEWIKVASSGSLYSLWLAWVLTLLLPLGTVLSGPAAAFISLASAALLSLLSGWFPSYMDWSPGRLSGLSAEWLVGGTGSAFLPALASIGIMLLSAVAASALLRRNTLPG